MIFSILAFLMVLFAPTAAHAESANASIVNSSGLINLNRAGVTSPIKAPYLLKLTDTITSLEKSMAVIELSKGQLKLQEKSSLVIADNTGEVMILKKGAIVVNYQDYLGSEVQIKINHNLWKIKKGIGMLAADGDQFFRIAMLDGESEVLCYGQTTPVKISIAKGLEYHPNTGCSAAQAYPWVKFLNWKNALTGMDLPNLPSLISQYDQETGRKEKDNDRLKRKVKETVQNTMKKTSTMANKLSAPKEAASTATPSPDSISNKVKDAQDKIKQRNQELRELLQEE